MKGHLKDPLPVCLVPLGNEHSDGFGLHPCQWYEKIPTRPKMISPIRLLFQLGITFEEFEG